MTLRRIRTGAAGDFWRSVEKIEKRVAEMPAWMKGELPELGKQPPAAPPAQAEPADKKPPT